MAFRLPRGPHRRRLDAAAAAYLALAAYAAAAVTLAVLLLASGCGSAPAPPPDPGVIQDLTEDSMPTHTAIVSLAFDRAFYTPGQPVHLEVEIDSQVDAPQPAAIEAALEAALSHLAEPVAVYSQEITLTGGRQRVSLSFTPPPDAPRGYGLDLALKTAPDGTLSAASTAFDVLERWTQHPRYGFLSDFPPGRSGADESMHVLARYHVNALQFYDWMYRHEQLLTPDEPYIDLLGRQLSRQTVDDLIAAAHRRNIAAMPYTAVYGSSLAFYEAHPDWALYNRFRQPVLFGENFMAIMDPRPGTPWTKHLLAQFADVLQRTDFDGIHLDQYGDPKEACDAQGECFDLAPALAELIDATREVVAEHRPGGAVVFNAVTNWPVEAVAPAGQDLVYIEVWPPYLWFNDLHHLVVQAQALGGGKPVVLAAYIDPQHAANVLLADAIIFASGGGHIELGEGQGGAPAMLADPYFPKYQPLSPELAQAVLRYYDFSLRYQDVTGPRTQDATPEYGPRLTIAGVTTDPAAQRDKVFPIVRQGSGFVAINLVNMAGIDQPEWASPLPAPPTPLSSLDLRLSGVERPVGRVWLASPDSPNLAAQPLPFEQHGGQLTLQVPSLEVWDLIVIEWSE